jgi:N-acetylglucosamine-6-phosphate deacetylase
VTLLRDARVVTPRGILRDGWVAVADGKIVDVGTGTAAPDGDALDLGGAWLLPGFIDLHMHGGGGHDVTSSPTALTDAVAFHAGHGTTRTLVSLVAAPIDALVEQLGWVADVVDKGDTGVVGAHLEGPFLSHARCGAQNPEYLRTPDIATFDALLEGARGVLRSITIAPELPGALELIARARTAGVVAAIGHSDARYADAVAAIEAGAQLATHLFNGMRPLHQREPGIVGAALAADLPAEVINDGFHVHAALVGLVARTPGRLVLVTDAIDAAGAGDGDFVLGDQQVEVRAGQARLAGTRQLAGSTLTMDDAVRRAVLDCGLSIDAAAAAAATNAARVLGLQDCCGSIAPGLDADLVVLDDDLHVRRVMRAGQWLVGTPSRT